MSLATYTDLPTQIANWLARDDLTAYIPDFITLFEASAQRRLKVRPQETVATLTPTAGVATLPNDYLGFKRVTWTGSPYRELTYVTPTYLNAAYPDQSAGTPANFTIEGSSLKVMPLDNSALSLLYFQRTAALSTALNWLYTNHPDAYLFGALCEANAFNKGKAFDTASLWKQRRDEVFDEIQKLNFNEPQGLAIRVMGATP